MLYKFFFSHKPYNLQHMNGIPGSILSVVSEVICDFQSCLSFYRIPTGYTASYEKPVNMQSFVGLELSGMSSGIEVNLLSKLLASVPVSTLGLHGGGIARAYNFCQLIFPKKGWPRISAPPLPPRTPSRRSGFFSKNPRIKLRALAET